MIFARIGHGPCYYHWNEIFAGVYGQSMMEQPGRARGPRKSFINIFFENEIKHIIKKSGNPDSPSLTANTVVPIFIFLSNDINLYNRKNVSFKFRVSLHL